jgi:hypothetical protein
MQRLILTSMKNSKKHQSINNTLKRESEEKIQLKTYRYSKLVSILAIASYFNIITFKFSLIQKQYYSKSE